MFVGGSHLERAKGNRFLSFGTIKVLCALAHREIHHQYFMPYQAEFTPPKSEQQGKVRRGHCKSYSRKVSDHFEYEAAFLNSVHALEKGARKKVDYVGEKVRKAFNSPFPKEICLHMPEP